MIGSVAPQGHSALMRHALGVNNGGSPVAVVQSAALPSAASIRFMDIPVGAVNEARTAARHVGTIGFQRCRCEALRILGETFWAWREMIC
jgi:hypothetical protein